MTTQNLDRETINALANTSGQLYSLLTLIGGATISTLIALTQKTERTVRPALTKLQAANLIKCVDGLWITVQKAVDNPADNSNGQNDEGKILPKNGAELPKNFSEDDEKGKILPKNFSSTYTRAFLSSSSETKEREGEGGLSATEKTDAEKTAVYNALAKAGVGLNSKSMRFLCEDAHWVTPDYANAHIGHWRRQKEPVNYLIKRMTDGDPAPQPPPPPPEAHWLSEAAEEILADTPTASPEPALPNLPPAKEWRGILDELGQQMTAATFNAWLKNTTAHWIGDNLHVLVRNDYALDWLQHRLLNTITRTAIYHAPRTKSVIIQVDSQFWAEQTVEAPHE